MRHRVKWSDCYWPPHVGRIEATIVFLLYFWRLEPTMPDPLAEAVRLAGHGRGIDFDVQADALRAALAEQGYVIVNAAQLADAMWEEGVETPTGKTPKSRTLTGAYMELANRILRRVLA